jgi:hypothetical protein
MFSLSDERFKRDLRYVSGEIWRISIAVGFALGKDIFCYPWLNERDASIIDTQIVKVLKSHNKLVLIPSSQEKFFKKACDYILIFEPEKYIFK